MEYSEYNKVRSGQYTATGEVYSATGRYTTDEDGVLKSIGGDVFVGLDGVATFSAVIVGGEPKVTIEDCEARYMAAVIEFVTEIVVHYQ